MIKESFGDEEQIDASMDVKSMFLLAVATSIDALMVGVTFAFLNVAIVPAVLFIGKSTFSFEAILHDKRIGFREAQFPLIRFLIRSGSE